MPALEGFVFGSVTSSSRRLPCACSRHYFTRKVVPPAAPAEGLSAQLKMSVRSFSPAQLVTGYLYVSGNRLYSRQALGCSPDSREGHSALSSGLRERESMVSSAELLFFPLSVLCCASYRLLGRGIYLQVSLRDYPGFKSCCVDCRRDKREFSKGAFQLQGARCPLFYKRIFCDNNDGDFTHVSMR